MTTRHEQPPDWAVHSLAQACQRPIRPIRARMDPVVAPGIGNDAGMAVQIAGITLPGPTEVLGEALGTARSVAGWGTRTAEVVAALPERADALLETIEKLITRIDALAARADSLVARVDAVAGAAERTVLAASAVAGEAAAVVSRAVAVTDSAAVVVTSSEKITAAASQGAADLLGTFEPLATAAAPLARTFIDELSPHEVAAAVRMVDQLPKLAEHLETDIMPILATLDRVGPDMHELLNVVKDLRLAINGIPGLAYLRRRGTP